jgi:hypothetical protein
MSTLESKSFKTSEKILKCQRWCQECKAFDWGYCKNKYYPEGTEVILLSDAQDALKEKDNIINQIIQNSESQSQTAEALINQIQSLKSQLEEVRKLLDKYDLKKFAIWMMNNGYCDTDIIAENGIEDY